VLKILSQQESEIVKRKQEAIRTLEKYEESLKQLRAQRDEYLAGQQLSKPPAGGNFRETTMRSAVKAMMWRVIAGSVTFVTTLQFSQSLRTALKVVGSDFFSKAATMFIGERLMNNSQAGRKSGSDSTGRSLAKALVWRLFAICNTLTVAVLISKDLSVASKIASTDAVFKTALMFFYERAWAKVEWGKEYIIEFTI
jgi:uncharacterized membrane protein